MKSNKVKHYTIPVFIPELACPFQCVFCDQKKISGRLKVPPLEEIRHTIEEHLGSFREKERVVEVGFFGGNFTGIAASEQESLLKLAGEYIKQGLVDSVRLSTRPDYIDRERLALLKKYNVKTIELGAQSLDENVLRLSGRGHKAEDVVSASQMIKNEGFSLGLQMMIGLPGDSLERSLFTARRIVDLGADNTRIYPTLVIKDTKLEEMFLAGKYKPLSLDEAVQWSGEIYRVFEAAGTKVIRMGLHPSEGLLNGDSLRAGPFHISFRELVLTEIWHELLESLTKMENDHVTIYIPPEEFNYAVGYNAKNKNYLSSYFSRIRFIKDPALSRRTYRADFS